MAARLEQVLPRMIIKTCSTTKHSTDAMSRLELLKRIQVRADHPMPAGNYTYYFEVTVVNTGIER
jgi:hypothetical protein